MRTHHYYSLSEKLLRQWFNIVGVDSNEIDTKYLDLSEISDLSDVSPYDYLSSRFGYSKIIGYIDAECKDFIHNLCSLCGRESSMEERIYQARYEKAYLGILRTATNLNLIPDDSKDYILNYDRLNAIIYNAMYYMNGMNPDELILFYNLIKNGQVREILSSSQKNGFLSYIVYLAMHPDNNIPDYKMFEDDKSSEISKNNLYELISNNLYSKTDYDVEQKAFPLSMIGLREIEIPWGIKAIVRNPNKLGNSSISKSHMESLLERYNMPFDRLSYVKTLVLTKDKNGK